MNSVLGLGIRFLHKSIRKQLDYRRYPKLDPADITEQNVKGSGPGGQSVNKTSNAVILKHVPTGVTVKCHDSRSLAKNREIANKKLVEAVDFFLNRENSIQEQIRRLELERGRRLKETAQRKREAKAKAKEEALAQSESEIDEKEASDEHSKTDDANHESGDGVKHK